MYGGYAGHRRAVKELAGRGIQIDRPVAGFMDEGWHTVSIFKVLETPSFVDIDFTEVSTGATHKQRIFDHDRDHFKALAAALGGHAPRRGDILKLNLGWPNGKYRVERTSQGYVASLDGQQLGEPFARLDELDSWCKSQGMRRAYLGVIEYEQATR